MIDKLVQIPITVTSRPFMSAADKCDFARRGYREDEYFIYGKANVYASSPDGGIVVETPDVPYVDRFMVRYPADATAASGNVIVEILNATTAMDIDRMWILCKDHHMRHGDVYVAITSKSLTTFALKKFDSARYAPISWKDPVEHSFPMTMTGNCGGGDTIEGMEDGLFWDMLTDLADALRSGVVDLGGIEVSRVYLTGWSQSGGYMLTYINRLLPMYEVGREKPVFDGYLAGGAAYTCAPGLNQRETPAGDSPEELRIRACSAPVIFVHTESENARIGGRAAQQPDSDTPTLRYRRYEIPGSTHDAKYNMFDYYWGSDDQQRVGVILKNPGMTDTPNDYPYEIVFHAAWQFLDDWVQKGVAPPSVARIEVCEDGLTNRTDEHGNAVGGYRLPPIDLPVCTWHPISIPIRADFAFDCTLYGYKTYFPVETLKRMYTSLAHYRDLVERQTRTLVDDGLVLAEDAEELVRRTVQLAVEAGMQ